MRRAVRVGAVLLALALAAGACGGGGGANDEELIAALESTFDPEEFADFGDVDLDVRCMAEAMVDAVGGAEQAEEKYGITPESVQSDADFDVDLEQADAESMADGLWGCGMDGAFSAGMTEAGLSQEDADCVTENLDESTLKKALASEFMGDAGADLMAEADEEIGSSMLDAMAECDVDLFG